MMHENHKKVNPRNRGKVLNGIRDFLKSYEETEIEFNEEADGKFFEIWTWALSEVDNFGR